MQSKSSIIKYFNVIISQRLTSSTNLSANVITVTWLRNADVGQNATGHNVPRTKCHRT